MQQPHHVDAISSNVVLVRVVRSGRDPLDSLEPTRGVARALGSSANKIALDIRQTLLCQTEVRLTADRTARR